MCTSNPIETAVGCGLSDSLKVYRLHDVNTYTATSTEPPFQTLNIADCCSLTVCSAHGQDGRPLLQHLSN